MTEFPKKLLFRSDDTELELKKVVTQQKRVANGYIDLETGEAIYEYTKSIYFFGTTLTLTKEKIEKMISKNIITVITIEN